MTETTKESRLRNVLPRLNTFNFQAARLDYRSEKASNGGVFSKGTHNDGFTREMLLHPDANRQLSFNSAKDQYYSMVDTNLSQPIRDTLYEPRLTAPSQAKHIRPDFMKLLSDKYSEDKQADGRPMHEDPDPH